MLIILTYIVSIKKIFSKRSNTLKSFILWNKLFPLKKKGSNEFNVHTGFFIFLFFFFLSLILSPFYSLFGLPLPTPLTICIQLERDPTNPL